MQDQGSMLADPQQLLSQQKSEIELVQAVSHLPRGSVDSCVDRHKESTSTSAGRRYTKRTNRIESKDNEERGGDDCMFGEQQISGR